MNNIKQLAFQIKWQFVIMHRNNLIGISIAVTAIYAFIFYVFRDFPYMEKLLTLLLFNDPSLIGLMFFGLAVILEKNQQVLPAFFITPMSVHYYLLARILTLSLIAWVCALGMAISALGFSFNFLHFSVGILAVAIIFSLAGVYLISYTTEFLSYMLLCIPFMFFLSLPLFNYYGLTDIAILKITPMQGATDLIVGSYETSLSITDLGIAYATTFAWGIGLYFAAYKVFYKRMKVNL